MSVVVVVFIVVIRLMMVLLNETSLKSVVAFPKSADGKDVMVGSPSTI